MRQQPLAATALVDSSNSDQQQQQEQQQERQQHKRRSRKTTQKLSMTSRDINVPSTPCKPASWQQQRSH
jgi:hypothetical protein